MACHSWALSSFAAKISKWTFLPDFVTNLSLLVDRSPQNSSQYQLAATAPKASMHAHELRKKWLNLLTKALILNWCLKKCCRQSIFTWHSAKAATVCTYGKINTLDLHDNFWSQGNLFNHATSSKLNITAGADRKNSRLTTITKTTVTTGRSTALVLH